MDGNIIDTVVGILRRAGRKFVCIQILNVLHILKGDNIAMSKVPQIQNGPTVLLPLHINGNHWCLAVADTANRTFALMDPMAEDGHMAEQKMLEVF